MTNQDIGVIDFEGIMKDLRAAGMANCHTEVENDNSNPSIIERIKIFFSNKKKVVPAGYTYSRVSGRIERRA